MKKDYLVSSYVKSVTDYPWWILLFIFVAVSCMTAGLVNLKFDNDYRMYFSKGNPQLQAFNAIQEMYSKTDSVLFVLQPENGTVFTPHTLQAIQELTEKSWQIPYSSRVDSLTNFQHILADKNELIVTDLVSNPYLSVDELENIKQIAINEPWLVNRLISKSGHVAGVNVTLQLPGKMPIEVIDVATSARLLITEIENSYPGIKVYLTGIAMMNNAFTESSIHDIKTLVPLMYIIVIMVLFLCFRSISATIAVVILIIFSVVSAIGVACWLGWSITPTSAIAPTIILTMAVADCVHVLVTQLHNMRIGHNKKQAIQESIRVNFQPILLTSLTTSIGFLSMNFSDAPPFRDLGNIVAIGVILAWIFSITFLPALMTVLPVHVKVKEEDDLDNSIMQRLAGWVICNRKNLLIGNGLIAVMVMAFVPQNQMNDEFVKYFDEDTEFRQSTNFLNNNLGGIYSIELSIHAQGEGDINSPNFLFNVDALVGWLLKQSEITHVNTVTDTFKRLNKKMHGDDDSWYKLPEGRDQAAQYLLLYELSLPYGLDINDQVNLNKSGVRVVMSLDSLSSNQMIALEKRIKQWLTLNMNDYKVDLASPTLMFSHIGERNIMRMLVSSMLALVLISIILMLAFKSVKLGMISLIPNLLPVGVAFGLWGLIDGQIGLGLSVVTGMTLGIVVDDTVHFISKYRRARIEKGMNSEDSICYAFSTVGVALWITSIVLVSGFMILSLSHYLMNANMGLMTAITLSIALFLDLLFLPPLLMSADKK